MHSFSTALSLRPSSGEKPVASAISSNRKILGLPDQGEEESKEFVECIHVVMLQESEEIKDNEKMKGKKTLYIKRDKAHWYKNDQLTCHEMDITYEQSLSKLIQPGKTVSKDKESNIFTEITSLCAKSIALRDVAKAYKAKSRQSHPDKRKDSQREFSEIRKAYEALRQQITGQSEKKAESEEKECEEHIRSWCLTASDLAAARKYLNDNFGNPKSNQWWGVWDISETSEAQVQLIVTMDDNSDQSVQEDISKEIIEQFKKAGLAGVTVKATMDGFKRIYSISGLWAEDKRQPPAFGSSHAPRNDPFLIEARKYNNKDKKESPTLFLPKPSLTDKSGQAYQSCLLFDERLGIFAKESLENSTKLLFRFKHYENLNPYLIELQEAAKNKSYPEAKYHYFLVCTKLRKVNKNTWDEFLFSDEYPSYNPLMSLIEAAKEGHNAARAALVNAYFTGDLSLLISDFKCTEESSAYMKISEVIEIAKQIKWYDLENETQDKLLQIQNYDCYPKPFQQKELADLNALQKKWKLSPDDYAAMEEQEEKERKQEEAQQQKEREEQLEKEIQKCKALADKGFLELKQALPKGKQNIREAGSVVLQTGRADLKELIKNPAENKEKINHFTRLLKAAVAVVNQLDNGENLEKTLAGCIEPGSKLGENFMKALGNLANVAISNTEEQRKQEKEKQQKKECKELEQDIAQGIPSTGKSELEPVEPHGSTRIMLAPNGLRNAASSDANKPSTPEKAKEPEEFEKQHGQVYTSASAPSSLSSSPPFPPSQTQSVIKLQEEKTSENNFSHGFSITRDSLAAGGGAIVAGSVGYFGYGITATTLLLGIACIGAIGALLLVFIISGVIKRRYGLFDSHPNNPAINVVDSQKTTENDHEHRI